MFAKNVYYLLKMLTNNNLTEHFFITFSGNETKRAQLQTTRPLLTIHQTSRLVWFICSFANRKKLTKCTHSLPIQTSRYIHGPTFLQIIPRVGRFPRCFTTAEPNQPLDKYTFKRDKVNLTRIDYSSFFHPLPSQTSH